LTCGGALVTVALVILLVVGLVAILRAAILRVLLLLGLLLLLLLLLLLSAALGVLILLPGGCRTAGVRPMFINMKSIKHEKHCVLMGRISNPSVMQTGIQTAG
jgi:hypothetical protein